MGNGFGFIRRGMQASMAGCRYGHTPDIGTPTIRRDIITKGDRNKRSCHSNSRAKVAYRRLPPARPGPEGFREKSSSQGSGIFPGKPCLRRRYAFRPLELEMTILYIIIKQDHESKGIYRKGMDRQVATACRTGHCSVHRVRLSVCKRRITGMGGGSHRLFQGILQVHLPDCLFPAGSGDTVLPPQPSAFLTMPKYETDILYSKFR